MKKILISVWTLVFLFSGGLNVFAQFQNMKPGDAVVNKEKGKIINDGSIRVICYPENPGEVQYKVYDPNGKEIVTGSQYISTQGILDIHLGSWIPGNDYVVMENGSGILTVILNGAGYSNKILKAPVAQHKF